MLIEVVAQNLGQRRFTRTRIANHDGVKRDASIRDVLSRAQKRIRIDNGLELVLNLVEANQLIKQVGSNKLLSAPLAELSFVSVFFLTILTNHLYIMRLYLFS